MLSIRKEPKNLKVEDLWIFQHELQREFAGPLILKKENVLVTGDLYFSQKYKEDSSMSYHANFFSFNAFKLFKKIIKLKLSFFKKRYIISDEWSNGYFHWLMDCLPRLILMESAGLKIEIVLPDSLRGKNYVTESLAMLGKNNFQFLEKDKWYFLRTLFFPVHLAPTGNFNDVIMKKLRSNITANNHTQKNLKIYISRSKASRRKIANEDEVLALMKNKGFTTVFCEEMSFKEQVDLFSKTACLVSNHGAGLSNMLFMSSGTSVLELRKKTDDHNNCYFSLASALNLNYYYLLCEPLNKTEDSHTADLIVNTDELLEQVEEIVKGKY